MNEEKQSDLYWHAASVAVQERRSHNKHHSFVLWFTGLSASGKSTLANALSREFQDRGIKSYVLDGDNIRQGLNKNLSFSPEDRKENIRRIGEVSKLFVDAGLIAMTAFISPYREDREDVRKLLRDGEFLEVYVKCGIDVCEQRDPKGIYKKARSGRIKEFTGISAPYEEPACPELTIETDRYSIRDCVKQIIDYLVEKGHVNRQYPGRQYDLVNNTVMPEVTQ